MFSHEYRTSSSWNFYTIDERKEEKEEEMESDGGGIEGNRDARFAFEIAKLDKFSDGNAKEVSGTWPMERPLYGH